MLVLESNKVMFNNGVLQINVAYPEGKKEELQAGERMLVDSDNLAFIYILEEEDRYIYIRISQKWWAELKEAHEQLTPVFINCNDFQIECRNVHAELTYLLENIDNNSNYGDEFVTAVANTFTK
ncbi:hypothetical protein [Bacillus alkalicellulosilyticus]|uniref:UPF0738 family protein n=1 Tax=Alkalihalobacterium alkalicellulosilyticum TaxID=1912214 RepID=UPI0009976A6E|nr:hypothetical protein [Bacillus alkalicellulosilyticus]